MYYPIRQSDEHRYTIHTYIYIFLNYRANNIYYIYCLFKYNNKIYTSVNGDVIVLTARVIKLYFQERNTNHALSPLIVYLYH